MCGDNGEVKRSGEVMGRSGEVMKRSGEVMDPDGVNSDGDVKMSEATDRSANPPVETDVNRGATVEMIRNDDRAQSDQTHTCPEVTPDRDFTTDQNNITTAETSDSDRKSPKTDVDDKATISDMSDRDRGASRIEEMYVQSDAVDNAMKPQADGSDSKSDRTRDTNKSDEQAANVSSAGDASDIRNDTKSESICESHTGTIPSVGFAVLNRVVLLERTDDALPNTSKAKDQAITKSEETTSDRDARYDVKMAWLETHGSQSPSLQKYTNFQQLASSSQLNKYKDIYTARSGHPATGTSDSKLNLHGDYVVQFKPIIKTRVYDKTVNKSELELAVSKFSGNLEGGFTESQLNSPKSKNKKSVDLSNVKSPEKKESELGKRLRDYDLESDKSCDSDKKKTYKDRIKNISAKIIHPCIETIKIITGNEASEDASSEDSSSSNKTSVITTEETDLSDDYLKSICSDTPSEKHDTARKISSGNVTLTQTELDENIDNIEETKLRDDNLEKGASSADRSQDSKASVLVKITSKGKHVSDECSEIQTSEDNLSPLEDDDDIIAESLVRKTVSLGDISPNKRESQTSPSSEGAMPSSEENLLAPESVKKKSEKHRRKHGLTSSEESIALTKSKSESETYTQESCVEFKSESTTASKTGLTSSEDGLTSGESDVSKAKDEVNTVRISNRDRIQNLISDNKTIMSRVGDGILQEHERIDGIDVRPLPRVQRVSESSESGISGGTDSSSTVELHRISERLLPISGSITLIKGKPPSERSTTPSWGSVSSLLDGLTWEKRAADSDKSLTSSLSTLHRETPIQDLNQTIKDTPQKTAVMPTAEIRPQIREKHPSESDTSSEETQQQKRITCEQVMRGAQSDSGEVFMTAHYCIDSVTFGIRRSLSEENLYSIEADTQAHREKKSVPKITPASNVFHDRACDACTFLVLLQTLIVRERAIHFAFRKVDACLVHNIGLGSQNAHIYSYILKRMPPCEFCTFPSVEKMILQLVESRHGVLMHNADNLAPIYVIFPPYSENNRTIGRVVHLKKKKVSDFAGQPRIRVMIADRYILFPKFHDSSVWKKSTLKRHDTPSKRIVSKIKTRNVPVKMDDIPELNENLSIAEEPNQKINTGPKPTKGTHIKKTPSKRKVQKCVLKKWSGEMTESKIQSNRQKGSSCDEPVSPNVVVPGSTLNEAITLNNKKRRFILKKWTVKLSPKSKRKISIRKYKELSNDGFSNLSKSDVTDKAPIPETKLSDANVDHKQIDGVVLVRKKRPWWKCPKKKKSVDKKPVDPTPKKKPDFYRKLIHPTYQELFSYRIKSRTGQVETRLLTRQDLLAQRLAYHYIKELTVGSTKLSTKEEEMKIIKPSLTDFQSREYEKRRTFIRDSIESVEQADKPINEEFNVNDSEELASNSLIPESALDVTKYDINQIDYHFETCPIIQEGQTPFKQFLKLQQVIKTTDFKDSWIEYHVEDCSYFMIDGTTVTDIKTVHLVLAEKKDKTCDCAEKLIKGGNIYVKDKSSQTFFHDLCLLFPKQLESGDIDLQGLFNPNIPFREFDENDVFRFYFISKHTDTKNRRIVDFCDVPMSKFNTVQENIKQAFSLRRNEIETTSQFPSKEPIDEIPFTSTEPPKAYRMKSLDDSFPSLINPPHLDVAEYQRFITPPRVDSESEDSTTMYSLEECLIYASEYLTDDSMSPPPEPLALSDRQMHKQSSAESVSLRQFTPSPRPVDTSHSQDDQSTSAKLSPQPERSDDKQIYYHLGEFTTQIQKGFSADQRIALPMSLEKDNSVAVPKEKPGQMLSCPANLIVTSPDKIDNQRPMEDTKLLLLPKVGDQNQFHTQQRIQLQESTSHSILASRKIDDQLRLGHSLDSIQRKRGRSSIHFTKDFDTQSLQIEDIVQTPRPASRPTGSFRQDSHRQHQEQRRHIYSQELISRHCTCKASETMEFARRVVAYFEENLQEAGCPYHDAFHEVEILKYRAHSHGDLSLNQGMSVFNQGNARLRQCLSLYDQGFDLSKNASLRQENKTRSSYPPFERSRGSYQRSRSQDISSTRRKYSLEAVVSPTRVLDIEQDACTSEQPCIDNQRTWSHGDLRTKRLSIFNQEFRGEEPNALDPLCMKTVSIPGTDSGREDQCVPQKNVNTGARPKENRFRERFRPAPEDIAQRRPSRNPGLPTRKDADGNDCPHLWNKWRDGPAPF